MAAQLKEALLRKRDVLAITALSRSRLYELIKAGQFPKQIEVVPGSRSVAWIESEVLAWIANRIEASRGKEAS